MTITISRLEDYSPVGPLDPIESKHTVALNRRSGWSMTIGYSPTLFRAFDREGSGVRIVDNGQAFVGIARQAHATTTMIDGQEVRVLKVSGVSALTLLADRPPLPVPSLPAGPWTSSEYFALEADPSAVFAALIDANAGQAAPADRRQVGGFTVAPPALVGGGTYGLKARWSPSVLDLIEELATAAGVGVTVGLPEGADALTCNVAPLTSNVDAVFDPDLGNVTKPEITSEPAQLTHVYVGGAGEGTARLVRLVVSPNYTPGSARIERWIEASSDDPAELDAIGAAELLRSASQRTLKVDIVDIASMRYGTHYRVGDLVTVRIRDLEPSAQTQERVTQVETSLGRNGAMTRSVTVGAGSNSLLTSDPATRRLGRLEGT